MRISSITKVAILATAAVMAIAPSAVAYDLTGQGSSAVGNYIEKCKVAYQNSSKDTFTYACLLYTSPSPRDGLLSRMPSSA